MCRDNEHGGRRCNNVNTQVGKQLQNLNAKKQYCERKLKQQLSKSDQEKIQKKLTNTLSQIADLKEEKKSYGEGKNFVMKLTQHTETVLNQLAQDGFEAYIVGGSVRDVLMGKESKDVDIEVYGGTGDEIAASLKKIGKVDAVGQAFGVLKIRLGKEDFDVSLPRRDSKTGEGHTGFDVEVDPNLSLEEATERRDYTINALMYSHKHGFIIDKHGGLKDLKNKQLKHVSDAFDEDPLRVLRGVQMSSRFDMELHPDTVEKAKSLKHEFSSIAKERVQMEFQKLYEKGQSSDKALKLLQQTEWDENLPGLKEANTEQLRSQVATMQTMITDKTIPKNRREVFLSASIASGIKDPKTRTQFLSYTCVGDKIKNEALQLTLLTSPSELTSENLKNWSYDMPRGLNVNDWVLLETSKGNKKQAEAVKWEAIKAGVLHNYEKDLIDGNDLLEFASDRKMGKWVGSTLKAVRAAQYQGAFSDKSSALKWLKENGVVEN